MNNEERISRLPVWAQDEIRNRDDQIAGLEAELSKYTDLKNPTLARRSARSVTESVPLESGDLWLFVGAPADYRGFQVVWKESKPEELGIMADGQIQILPKSSNWTTIRKEEFR